MVTLPNHMLKIKNKKMAEQKKVKKMKRNRVNPTIRWSEGITLDLIMRVLECMKDSPESFEKPSAFRFYESLASGCTELHGISWRSMRDKMRSCRNAYIAANKWKEQKGADLMAGGDEKIVVDHVKRMCPHYDKLHQIFGHWSGINPGVTNQPSQLCKPFLSIDCDTRQSPITSQLCEEFLSTDCDTIQSPITSQLCEEFLSIDCDNHQSPIIALPVSEFAFDAGHSLSVSREDAFSLLKTMQEEKMKFEREKFEWQKKKEQQELDNQFKLKQMELEQNERLKIFEYKLQYGNNNVGN